MILNFIYFLHSHLYFEHKTERKNALQNKNGEIGRRILWVFFQHIQNVCVASQPTL